MKLKFYQSLSYLKVIMSEKSFLLLLILSVSLSSLAQPIIANYSFEDWAARYGKTAPTGWKCDSLSINNNSIKKVSGGSQGTYALQINTVTDQMSVVSALVEREDSITSIPGDLLFDYKVVNNNSEVNGLYIEIYFKDSKKKDLKDFQWSSSGNNSTFAAGNMPISFKTGEIPKYYLLRISYFYTTAVAGEYTVIDNLRFAKGSGSIKNSSTSCITAYPNPANDVLNFSDQAGDKLYKARLVSIDGKVSEFTVNNSTIDISSLNRGIYMLELYNSENQIIKREKLSVVN